MTACVEVMWDSHSTEESDWCRSSAETDGQSLMQLALRVGVEGLRALPAPELS